MRVLFLRSTGGRLAGTIADLDEPSATWLIERDYAEPAADDTDAPPATTKPATRTRTVTRRRTKADTPPAAGTAAGVGGDPSPVESPTGTS